MWTTRDADCDYGTRRQYRMGSRSAEKNDAFLNPRYKTPKNGVFSAFSQSAPAERNTDFFLNSENVLSSTKKCLK